MFKTMRKMLLVILALVLFACVASAAQAEEQGLVTVPALSAGFGPSLQAANMSFLLAAFAKDADGVQIPCGEMHKFTGKEFFIPRSATLLPVAELTAAYSACLVQANAAANNTMVVPVPSTASAAGGTIRTVTTTPTTKTPTNAATTTTSVRDLQEKLNAAQTRLSEVQTAAEKRFAQIRVEEQAEAARQLKKLEAEFDKKLAAAQAAAGNKGPDPKLAELEDKLQRLQAANKVLEEENSTLKNKLAARGGVPPGPSTDWDGLLKAAGLKHRVKRVVIDPEIKKRAEEAQKRISEQQARGRTSPCALLLTTPRTEMPEGFSLFGGMLDVSRADCEAAAANPNREVEVLGWNPLAIAGYVLVFALLAFAWPGYRAFRKFLNPMGEINIPKPKPVDLARYPEMKKDPVWNLWGPDLVAAVSETIRQKFPQSMPNVVVFGYVPYEVWVRCETRDELRRIIKLIAKTHCSLVPNRKGEGNGYPNIFFSKYNHSQAPGDAIKAS